MKVLHVIPSLASAHGGPTRAIALIERALIARNVNVETATTEDDDGPRRHNGRPFGMSFSENGVIRHYFPKWLNFYTVSPGLAWWLVQNVPRYDVVHIHALFSFSSIVAAWASRWAGVPYVLRPLGTLTHYGLKQRRPWLKRLSLALLEAPALRHAAAVHFTSDDEQREAADCGVRMRGVVIPLGVEAHSARDPALVRARFPGLQDASYLLFLSRLDPKKNVEGLLRAFAQCVPHWPGDVRLLMAGGGDPSYVARLKALADDLQLSGRIVWVGHIDGELKASALAGASAFVLPSYSENFGIAAAEALMAGLPCVLGQGVAIAQDVADAGAGLSVTPDPAAIAVALMQVMADPQVRDIMSAHAAALAHDKYSAQVMGARLVQLYSVMKKR